MRYLCQVSLSLKVPKFHSATALQHCLNHLVTPLWFRTRRSASLPCGDRGEALLAYLSYLRSSSGLRRMTTSLFYGFRSFHCSFTIHKS